MGHCIHQLSLQKVLMYLFDRDVKEKTLSSANVICLCVTIYWGTPWSVDIVQPILGNIIVQLSFAYNEHTRHQSDLSFRF